MATKAKRKSTRPEEQMPEGFVPVSSKLDGWFIVEEGNSVQGFIRDSFNVTGQYGTKKVYKIEVSAGETRIVDKDKGETDATEGALIGVDEKGFLKKLGDLPRNSEVFVKCLGKSDKPAKKGQQPAWLFSVGSKPPKVNPNTDDDNPF